MIDSYLMGKIEFYKNFLSSNTISATQRIKRIDDAVTIIQGEVRTRDEYVEAYKALTLIQDIIYEMCDNYLVDSSTQETLREKMNLLTLLLKKKRGDVKPQTDSPDGL